MQHPLPVALLQSLQGVAGFNEAAFIEVHSQGRQITSIRFNPEKYAAFQTNNVATEPHLPIQETIPWCPNGRYLSERPSFTFDPLFHAGLYYVQEASSMFLWHVLQQTVGENRALKVLDLSAAPGGKSTLLASYFIDGLLVANDVIKSRANILAENITKWGSPNVMVTNNDPKDFARLPNFFDVVVIDAPCSGSGLFRKDNAAIEEWSEDSVQMCSQRQQRILADAYTCLKQNGVLIYSTCSYSTAEDEEILDWLMDTFNLLPVNCNPQKDWNIIESLSPKNNAYGYRFYPDKIKGEGFFIAAFIKKDGSDFYLPQTNLPTATKQEIAAFEPWVNDSSPLHFFNQKETILALPKRLQQDVAFLQKQLYIKQAGISLGTIKGKDVIPNHALALSNLVNENVGRIAFTKEQAIQYLQRKDIAIDAGSLSKGWQLASYCGIDLGWLKVLPNRINNYYPTEWRILKN